MNYWLNEDLGNPGEVAASQPSSNSSAGMQVPVEDPAEQPQDDSQQQQPAHEQKPDQEVQEPVAPDMPEEENKPEENFETWKMEYFKNSAKGDVRTLLDGIHSIRDTELDSYPRKFVEDNLQVLFLRQNSNIEKANKEIRRLIRQELDQNNPSVSLTKHIFSALQPMSELNNVFIKLKGTLGMKGDLHRKYMAALWKILNSRDFKMEAQRKKMF